MNNTIPFHSAPHAPQITVDVNILTMLKQAASCLSEMASENVYLAAIGPDMELTIIVEEDAPSILPCFDEDDALISVKGAPLFIWSRTLAPSRAVSALWSWCRTTPQTAIRPTSLLRLSHPILQRSLITKPTFLWTVIGLFCSPL